MEKQTTREQLLELALASPHAVARHDRQAWVSLFSRHAVIEDPVGSKPHQNGLHDAFSGVRGSGPLERFFDTFIAPNQITFHVEHDVVASPFVVRDLTIAIGMGNGLAVRVPMHVVYEMVEEDGVLRIAHLRAHWELLPMVRQVLGHGRAGWAAMGRLGMRMVRYQGVSGVLGFSRGVFGIHKAGKHAVERFVDAVNGRNKLILAELFGGEQAVIEFPATRETHTPASFCDRLQSLLSITKLIACGYTVSCTFTIRGGDTQSRGIALFEFNSRTRKLHTARLFCE